MSPLPPLLPKLLGGGIWRTSLVILVLTLASAGAAHADSFQPGAVITYDQGAWTGTNPGGLLLVADYDTVYASTFGVVRLGLPSPGFSMGFDQVGAVLAYIPASGTPGPLNGNVLDPTTTSSGMFGGDVLALELNVDFSNAGFLLGTSRIPFGNLVLTNFSTLPNLNGLTVRQFLADANTCLGGGSCIFSVGVLDQLTQQLNNSFASGTVSTFAQTNLALPGSVTPVPEPSSLLLLTTGLFGLGWARWQRRR